MKISDLVPLGETITKLEGARDASIGGVEARRLYDAAIASLKDPKYPIAETEVRLKNVIGVELKPCTKCGRMFGPKTHIPPSIFARIRRCRKCSGRYVSTSIERT